MSRIYPYSVVLEIQSGRIQANDNVWTAVTFPRSFKNIPNVVCTLEDYVGVVENLSVRNITLTGFEIHQEMKTASTLWIQWIALKGVD